MKANRKKTTTTIVKMPTRGTASCTTCVFSRKIIITVNGTADCEMCECHVARPTSYGFPTIRPDDFCGLHVKADTMERTFANVSPSPATNA